MAKSRAGSGTNSSCAISPAPAPQDAAIGSYVMKALDGVVPGAMPPVFDANKPRLPAPKLYDYDTIKSSVAPSREPH